LAYTYFDNKKEEFMTPEEAKSIAAFLIADFENEMQTTQRVLAAVPADRLEYQPDAKAKTGLGLARHIALEDEWLLNCVANGEFTPPPDDSDECGIMNPTDAVARYTEKVPVALDRVRAMSGDQLVAVLDLFGMMQAPAVTQTCLASMTSRH
jgi:hypothetical protein